MTADNSACTQPGADPPPERVLLDVVLYPHRSLTPTGFWVFMGALGAISFAAGIAFLAVGAWPVFGFFGLDVLLMFWFFRLNFRDGQLYETVQLTERALVVRRVMPGGRVYSWTFQPHWLRVEMADAPRPGSQLTLRSHGQALTIAGFLAPEERADFARTLRRALADIKGGAMA